MNLIATGNTAEVFDYCDEKILKLFKTGYPEEFIKMEFNNVPIVNDNGIPSPKAYEIVKVENRVGIVYEKISGTSLMDEVFASMNDTRKFEKIMTEFTAFHLNFTSCHSTKCISYKDYLNYIGYKDAALLPDGDFLCHGDFHFGNLMRSLKDGTEKIYVIDFMNLCHGPREYDIARAYVLITEDNLGDGIPPEEKKKILAAKNEAGKMYLDKMGVSLKDLEPFLPAIKFCRNREKL